MHITTWLFNSVKCCDWRARWNSVFMSPFRMRAHPAMAVFLFLFLFFFRLWLNYFTIWLLLVLIVLILVISCHFINCLSFFLDYTTHITWNTFMGASYLKFPLEKVKKIEGRTCWALSDQLIPHLTLCYLGFQSCK